MTTLAPTPAPTTAPTTAPTAAPTPAPVTWTKEQLYAHLQMAINVEFFTIPLYLTAAASVKPSARSSLTVQVSGEDQNGNPLQATFGVYDAVFSVAVEEMYHLMWICNVAKSVGMPIQLQAPDMTKLPTQLNLAASIASAYTGPANLADVIDLLVAIETPDPTYQYPATPTTEITSFSGPVAPQASYNSIGDLYHALAYGLNQLFPTLHQSSYDAFQKSMIAGNYPAVPGATDLASAMNCIAAIVEQGEGTGVDGFIPSAYQPLEESDTVEDKFTHYERFLAIQQNISDIKPSLYPTPASGDPSNAAQQNLTNSYSLLLQSINDSYAIPSNTLNTTGMGGIGTAIDTLWAASLLPQWTYVQPVQQVPLELHVCQGLNSCAGHGVNGSGTMPGDGDCATVNHTCQGSNDCRGQGGCGYPGMATKGGTANQYAPGQNACKGLGGCASPISVWQVFSGGTMKGDYVWCEARNLFEQRMQALDMQTATPSSQPTPARLEKSTNNGSAPLADNTSCPT